MFIGKTALGTNFFVHSHAALLPCGLLLREKLLEEEFAQDENRFLVMVKANYFL